MPADVLERLATALREAGIGAKVSDGVLYVDGREMAVGVVPLSRRLLRRGQYRARPPQARLGARLVLAYARREDVVAAWEAAGGDFTVSLDAIRRAASGDVVAQLSEGRTGVVGNVAAVFRPELAWTYFSMLDDVAAMKGEPMHGASRTVSIGGAGLGGHHAPLPYIEDGPPLTVPPDEGITRLEDLGGGGYEGDPGMHDPGVDPVWADAVPTDSGASPGAPPAASAERVVNTRFITGDDRTLEGVLPPGGRCWFWLDVGRLRPDTIEDEPSDVTGVADGARLTVALFGFPGEIEIDPKADVGELELTPGGSRVLSGPRETEGGIAFPVRTPARHGVARLRCNLYCERVLVQSRLVTVEVGDHATRGRPQVAEVEYALSRKLQPATLNGLPSTDLSISVNGDDATHQIRFFEGADEPRKVDATLTTAELENLIEACRTTLRTVAWGRTSEWEDSYKTWNYQTPPSPEVRHQHLVSLATIGYRQFGAIAGKLGGGERTRELMKRLRKPIRIDLAANPSFFIPAAVLYDHPLETGSNLGIRACPSFEAWLASGRPREASDCLCGECPSHSDVQVVCPSGFWGFRHELGWPADDRLEATGTIAAGDEPAVGIGVATDLQLLAEHRGELEALLGRVDVAETRADLFEMLRRRDDEVVYLYCHGGATPAKAAYFRVGGKDEPKVTASELVTLGLELPDLTTRRPLVFLNGCRTGAVDPRDTFNLIHGFVNEIGAAGVIATEITVFEPMASVFAMHFLRGFMKDGMSVGAAIRHARLELLRDGNPLGLAYVPYVLAGTRRAT